MVYRVVWQFENREPQAGFGSVDKSAAVSHAKDMFSAFQKSSGATSVEVVDDTGKVVYSYSG